MAFHEHAISEAISRGSTGGPRGKRIKVYVEDGRLTQVFNWSRPLHTYDLKFGIKTQANFEEIRSLFYLVMFTPYTGFLYKDWADYEATQSNSTATLISGSDYQLQRKYTHGAATYKRDIFKIRTATVYRTRSAVTSVATATIDNTTGIATISGHVAGDTYTWEGEFYVPVTFVDDAMDTIETSGDWNRILQTLPSIRLEEIRL